MPAAESRARAMAEALEANFTFVKLAGGDRLTEEDFEKVKELIEGKPRWSTAVTPPQPTPRPEPAPSSAPPTKEFLTRDDAVDVRWNDHRFTSAPEASKSTPT